MTLAAMLVGLAVAGAAPATKPTPRIVDLVSAAGGHCALRDDGHVVCWGEHPAFPAKLGVPDPKRGGSPSIEVPTRMPDLPPMQAIALGVIGWGVTRDGDLFSWESVDGRTNEKAPVPKLGKLVDIVAADLTVCARRSDETIACWSPYMGDQQPWELRARDGAPLPPGDLRGVGLHSSTFTLETKSGPIDVDLDRAWALHGSNERRVDIDAPSRPRTTWAQAYARRRLDRAVDDAIVLGTCMLADRRVWCWPGRDTWTETPSRVGRADLFAVDDDWACLSRAESVRCFARMGGFAEIDLGAAPTLIRISGRLASFGSIDGRLLIVDLRAHAPVVGPPSIRREVRLGGEPIAAFGPGHEPCVVLRDAGVQCIGEETSSSVAIEGKSRAGAAGFVFSTAGVVFTIGDAGTAKRVASDIESVFAIGDDSALLFDRKGAPLLGNARDGKITPLELPAELEGRKPATGRASFAMSKHQQCVLEASGEVHCSPPKFDKDPYTREKPVEARAVSRRVRLAGSAKALFGDQKSICAHLENDDVVCWGHHYGGPDGLAPEGEITDAITRAR